MEDRTWFNKEAFDKLWNGYAEALNKERIKEMEEQIRKNEKEINNIMNTKKRYVEIFVTEEFSERHDEVKSFVFDYEKNEVEFMNLKEKMMFVVKSKDNKEVVLLIDAKFVEAIDFNSMMLLF